MRKTSKYALIIFASVIIGLVVYRSCKSDTSRAIPITYDKSHVESLYGFDAKDERFKNREVVFKKVAELKNPLIDLYNCFGEGWEGDPGDFRKIKIKLKNGRIVEYDNYDGWDKVDSQPTALLLPRKSTKVKKNDYSIILDAGKGNCILMLLGHQYPSESANLLTLIYIGQDNTEVVFNRNFTLFEIREDVQGYKLIGRIGSEDSYADPYEIAIKDGRLTFEKLPLQKVYERKDPHIILHNSIGWSEKSPPGEFTRLEIAAPAGSKDQENQVFNVAYYNDTWAPFSAPVIIPTDTATIQQTPNFIIIENAVGRTIILNERDHRDSTASCITILRSAPYYPTSLFNGYFSLLEITEDDAAYHLLGTRKDAVDPNKVYEITVKKGNMSEVKRNW